MSYKHTILHVDNDPHARQSIAEFLQYLGYNVTSLSDPSQVMHEIINSHQRMVILDIEMAQVNGLDLLREIKHNDGSTQVIVLTGITNMQTILQSFRWGAEYCFFKPLVNYDPFANAIRRTFWKIDQWWTTLEELTKHRRLVTYKV